MFEVHMMEYCSVPWNVTSHRQKYCGVAQKFPKNFWCMCI